MRLADYIEQRTSAILLVWEVNAARMLPAATNMDSTDLRDHAEQILLAIAKDLRTSQSAAMQHAKSLGHGAPAPGGAPTAAETHAGLRAMDGFTMQQMVAEYRALRASVLSSWLATAPALDSDLVDDIGRFNEAIDQAVAESVDRFTQEIDRWRNIFLGVLGHDLRAPLNAILMSASLISKLPQGSPIDIQTAGLMRSGARMKELLDDLLDFTHGSLAHGVPICRVATDIATVCEEELEVQRLAHPTTDIQLEVTGVTTGEWDPSRLKQVIGNLVSNAASYGSPGKPVAVGIHGTESTVQIRVENSGPAIPREMRSVLFEPLRRLASNASPHNGRRSEHLGLGLYIVQEVVRSHGGTVTLDSDDGTTVFRVTLPRAGTN